MTTQRPSQQGFTLIELMVAVTVGLLLLAGLSTLFAGNNHAQMEIERANRQVENGRYAMQLLGGDLRNAGFYSDFNPTALALPKAAPDPCSTDIAVIRTAIVLPVQGYNDSAAALDCLKDAGVRADTDVVVVRHTATCIVDAADCEPAAFGGPFLQASQCDNLFELGHNDVSKYYNVDTHINQLALHKRDCGPASGTGTAADVRRLQTHIYFVSNNSSGTDGVPTLKRAEVTSQGANITVNIVPLAEGIENMQLEYGMDTSNDGVADLYTIDPATASGCADAECAVVNWNNVVSIKVNLLARTLTPSMGHVDSKSYVLGAKADGSDNTIAATNDKYKRHVFSAVIGLPNPAGRKTS